MRETLRGKNSEVILDSGFVKSGGQEPVVVFEEGRTYWVHRTQL